MDKQNLSQMWGYFGMVHHVTGRAIAQIPADKLSWRPAPPIRTFHELVVHLLSQEAVLVRGAKAGAITEEDFKKEGAQVFKTPADLAAYGKRVYAETKSIVDSMTDADMQKIVKTPFGDFQAAQMLKFAYDEHWHHRGQLYTYLRLAGVEPVMLYDYPQG